MVAQRVFHTRVLPHILLPGTPFGLHDSFHGAALEALKCLGGTNGLLILPDEARSANSSVTSRPTLSPPVTQRSSFSLGQDEIGEDTERTRISRAGRGSQEPKRLALL